MFGLRLLGRRRLASGPIARGVFAECIKLRRAGSHAPAADMLQHGANLVATSESIAAAGTLFYIHAQWTGSIESLRRAEVDTEGPAGALAARALALRGLAPGAEATPVFRAYDTLGKSLASGPAAITGARDAILEATSGAGDGWLRETGTVDGAACLAAGGEYEAAAEAFSSAIDAARDGDVYASTAAADPLADLDPEAYVAASLALARLAGRMAALVELRAEDAPRDVQVYGRAMNLVATYDAGDGSASSAARDAAHAQQLAAHVALLGAAHAARVSRTADSEDFLVASGLLGSAQRSLSAAGLGGAYHAAEAELWEGAMLLRVKGREREGKRLHESGQHGTAACAGRALRWWDRGGVLLGWSTRSSAKIQSAEEN